MNEKLTYISLFSGGGVGCFGFKEQGYTCVATNEYIDRRLNIQKNNNKCLYESGYILGDITDPKVFNRLSEEIETFKKKEKVKDIDVVIATPPCQGMSVANHKKDNGDIYRNSLVVDAIKIVREIEPKFFVFENVQAFLNTKCYEQDKEKTISEAIHENLSESYVYHSEVINLKDYGANSSRTRTLVIGVRNDYAEFISPVLLFPSYEKSRNLKELIFDLPRLTEMGTTYKDDIYHNFKPYRKDMRLWVENLEEGKSAFDNKSDSRKPHRIIDGKIVINQNKNGDKYQRQEWNKGAACIHTRNDIFASQNTIHPEDDRVFSIRELMIMMNIPKTFKWSDISELELNKLNQEDRQLFLKDNEVNIRQSIGESVPTIIMDKIARNIKLELQKIKLSNKEINTLIEKESLDNLNNLITFIEEKSKDFHLYTILKISELANMRKQDNAAYYTELKTLNEIYLNLPEIKKDTVNIIEPSVGVGNFLPFIMKKYEDKKIINLHIFDIDKSSLIILQKVLDEFSLRNNNLKIEIINEDFLNYEFDTKYDLLIGNPPFLKLNKKTNVDFYREKYKNNKADNMSIFFLEQALDISNEIIMIFPKCFLHNESFSIIRDKLKDTGLTSIIDFGEKGFSGVKIETICLCINTSKRNRSIDVTSVTHNFKHSILKTAVMDNEFPNWLIYRNDFFNSIVEKLTLGVFKAYRDRQITNKYLKSDNDGNSVKVIRSRNIDRNGSGLISIKDYDKYISKDEIEKFSISKFLYRNDVFLVPNMTYYPRMIKKPDNIIVNGSVAILEPIDRNMVVDNESISYIGSKEFQEFYSIARNKSTRSLNIDNNSVFYFGILKEHHNEDNE